MMFSPCNDTLPLETSTELKGISFVLPVRARRLCGVSDCINARRARATAFPYKEDLVSRARV